MDSSQKRYKILNGNKARSSTMSCSESMWIFITVTVFSMRIIITGSMHAKRPLIWNQIWAKHLRKKFKMNLHIRKRYGIMPSVWGSTDKNNMNLWSNIHPNSTNEDLLSVSESRDHTGILKPDDARDCLKILSRTDLHTGSLQTSQDQIYQETSNKTADDFWKCNSIENCLYRITQQMKPFRLITGMPRAPELYNRYSIETFIIRDKVLQHSVSHTFRCSRISINSI